MASAAYAQTAEPEPPDTLTVISNERRPDEGSSRIVQAQAGNVSAMQIDDIRTTRYWQGYYGNVTGTITLDDALNNTLYSWDLSQPEGEVYASNGSSVTWTDVSCLNWSSPVPDPWNITQLESSFHINESDLDGFDETFNKTYSDATGFKVGGITINNLDNCHMLYTYVDDNMQSTSFQEVLLTDNVSLIFTALLEDSVDGFKTGADPNDFQMLVAEDGSPGEETTTTSYYFYVELS